MHGAALRGQLQGRGSGRAVASGKAHCAEPIPIDGLSRPEAERLGRVCRAVVVAWRISSGALSCIRRFSGIDSGGTAFQLPHRAFRRPAILGERRDRRPRNAERPPAMAEDVVLVCAIVRGFTKDACLFAHKTPIGRKAACGNGERSYDNLYRRILRITITRTGGDPPCNPRLLARHGKAFASGATSASIGSASAQCAFPKRLARPDPRPCNWRAVPAPCHRARRQSRRHADYYRSGDGAIRANTLIARPSRRIRRARDRHEGRPGLPVQSVLPCRRRRLAGARRGETSSRWA